MTNVKDKKFGDMSDKEIIEKLVEENQRLRMEIVRIKEEN